MRTIWHYIFSPLGLVYGMLMRGRTYAYAAGLMPHYLSALPVISIGNVSVGGNAKTPLTLWLVEQLKGAGFKPVILTRGYGGSEHGPVRIPEASGDVTRFGDEPILLLKRSGIPVVVCRKRADGARLVERERLGDVLVLDDAHQHLGLERDLNILCVAQDSVPTLSREFLLPAGPLREFVSDALKRTQILVLVDRSGSAAAAMPAAADLLATSGVPIYRARTAITDIVPLREWQLGKTSAAESLPAGTQVRLMSSIAKPGAFAEAIKARGFEVQGHWALRDHAPLETEMFERILWWAKECPLLCTEKDAVKLPTTQAGNIWVARSALVFEGGDEFHSQVTSHIHSKLTAHT